MPSYFLFSDAHLGAPHRSDELQRQEKILDFLSYIQKCGSGLFIVGDLFDFWFEYRHAIPNRHFAILAKLHELKNQGIPVEYVAGNHDMWLGDFLQQEVGIKIHHQGISKNLCGYKCFIVHGDGTAKRDVGYRVLKKFLTHPINIFLYRLLSPDIGFPLAKKVSHTSRTFKECDESWDQEYLDYANGKFAEGFDVIIMGHTHKPKIEKVDQKTFINLGDWLQHFTYCQIDENGAHLKIWPENETRIGSL